MWIRKEKVLYVLWKDTNVVCVASTIHSGRADSTVKRRVKQSNGSCVEVQVPIPNAIENYNQHMAGVDW